MCAGANERQVARQLYAHAELTDGNRFATLLYAALLDAAKRTSPSVAYDEKGYAPEWRDNLIAALALIPEIERDLKQGAGQELDRKLCAAHSSAALVVNTFGPWRNAPASLTISGMNGFQSLKFEVQCSTGLGGEPPHLDFIAEGDSVVAVESKCTEWMKPKPAKFSRSYEKLRPLHGQSPWFDQMQELRQNPRLYAFLDAAQIIKHAFGLLKCYPEREVQLVYLYWEPQNTEVWPEFYVHRTEANDLAAKVQTSSVRLIPLSYRELWAEWERRGAPDHMPYLKQRYNLDITHSA